MTASTPQWELCPDCGYQTPHDVSIRIRTESPNPENAKFSREPYRVSECLECGVIDEQRMNNA